MKPSLLKEAENSTFNVDIKIPNKCPKPITTKNK